MSEQADTQNFMSVDSFSQLPFIRPSTSAGLEKSPPPSSSPGIRLFGFEVPQEPLTITPDHNDDDTKQPSTTTTTTTTSGGNSNSENSRKFECHYCCRNFPTSQALGGHQNAHKRERQHAKRAHLQSAIAAAHHHSNNFIDVGHRSIYGFLNYPHRLASLPTTAQYPSWNGSSNMGPRVYGGLGSVAQPINGNPLPGIWRVPVASNGGLDMRLVQQNYPHQQHQSIVPLQLPSQLLQTENQGTMGIVAAGGYLSPMSSALSSSRSLQNQMVCEVKENVSLDLHL